MVRIITAKPGQIIHGPFIDIKFGVVQGEVDLVVLPSGGRGAGTSRVVLFDLGKVDKGPSVSARSVVWCVLCVGYSWKRATWEVGRYSEMAYTLELLLPHY